jgi:hypothetical protein
MHQFETDIEAAEGEALEHALKVQVFGALAAQELAPGRGIEEEVPNLRVPGNMAKGSRWRPFSLSKRTPCSISALRLAMEKRLTEAILARASPRNPRLATCCNSCWL